MSGYIKLHRKIRTHWLFDDAEKLRAWMIILLEVNHSDQKVLIKGQLFTVRRGESLKSLETWASIFGKMWNKSKVRRFFELLKSDQMIVTKSERKTTRITICNYDSYQGLRNNNETDSKRTRNDNETIMTPNKNEKNEKNEKNKGFVPPSLNEVKEFFAEKGFSRAYGEQAFNYYDVNNWENSKGKPVKNWKSTMNNVWLKPEAKKKYPLEKTTRKILER